MNQALSPLRPSGRAAEVAVSVVALLVLAVSRDLRAEPALLSLQAAAGLAAVICWPAVLLHRRLPWQGERTLHRIAVSVAGVLLVLMVGALLLNTVLPVVGVARPLDAAPVLLMLCAVHGGLLALPARQRPPARRSVGRRLSALDCALHVASVLLPLLAVAGAVRLNNGLGPALTMVMLTVCLVALAALLWKHDALSSSTVPVVLYAVAVALLLATSMRGWYITGHDIQREFKVLELTSQSGRWDYSVYPDGYNACLSITVLPVVLGRVLALPDPYVFKFVFQLLFGLVPVIVYAIGREVAPGRQALLGALFFMAFPTYFTDMPFLNRQEIAFLFLSVGVLYVVADQVPVRRRRACFVAAAAGVLLAHYSTSYVLVAVLLLTLLGSALLRLAGKRRSPDGGLQQQVQGGVLTTRTVLTIVLAVAAWNLVVTDTGRQLGGTLADALHTLSARSDNAEKSSDTAYSLFVRARPDPQQRLLEYGRVTRAESAARPDQYYPPELIERYPSQAVPLARLPLTGVGRFVEERTGLSVTSINDATRAGSAYALQVFVAIGIAAAALRRARARQQEFLVFAVASATVVALPVVVPVLSVEYGLLRAFQQALIVLAPLVAIGAGAAFTWFGERRQAVAEGAGLLFFASLTGLLPQTLGGYPPQLHLNNQGLYYDIYYTHTEEVLGIDWLLSKADIPSGQVQAEVQSDRYTYNRVQRRSDTNPLNDIYPPLLRRDSYVFLGMTTATESRSTVSYSGDLITYRYPTALLDDVKDRVYDNGGAVIYR